MNDAIREGLYHYCLDLLNLFNLKIYRYIPFFIINLYMKYEVSKLLELLHRNHLWMEYTCTEKEKWFYFRFLFIKRIKVQFFRFSFGNDIQGVMCKSCEEPVAFYFPMKMTKCAASKLGVMCKSCEAPVAFYFRMKMTKCAASKLGVMCKSCEAPVAFYFRMKMTKCAASKLDQLSSDCVSVSLSIVNFSFTMLHGRWTNGEYKYCSLCAYNFGGEIYLPSEDIGPILIRSVCTPHSWTGLECNADTSHSSCHRNPAMCGQYHNMKRKNIQCACTYIFFFYYNCIYMYLFVLAMKHSFEANYIYRNSCAYTILDQYGIS